MSGRRGQAQGDKWKEKEDGEREDGRDDVILSVFPRGDSIAC